MGCIPRRNNLIFQMIEIQTLILRVLGKIAKEKILLGIPVLNLNKGKRGQDKNQVFFLQFKGLK